MVLALLRHGIMDQFSVHFWGVRGSLPTSGWEFAKFGGNTSCIEVRVGNEIIILDAGSGLLPLGQRLGDCGHATFFISHFHWDHIHGFPFFRPAYQPENAFTLYGPGEQGDGLEAALTRQMQPPHFPVALGTMRAQLDFRSVHPGDEIRVGPARVQAAALNHPQGSLGYRISMGDVSVVYATDTEHLASGVADAGTRELARDADLLIYDAQYTDDEYDGRSGPSHTGWGHSTALEACRAAQETGVRRLVLFHHDPSHDDRAIERMLVEARAHFPNVIAAQDGMTLDLAQQRMLTAEAA
jgi:phosphoribosyl 1,2-cyclic phosphodiesterase